jgi:hypothetical protein
MNSSSSPRDPAFWLHHCYIDYIWSRWQERNNETMPPNMSERLRGNEIQNLRVRNTVHTAAQLDYTYDTGICAYMMNHGSTSERITLEKGKIILVKINSGDYAKIKVYATSKFMATLIIKSYNDFIPEDKTLIFVHKSFNYDVGDLKITTSRITSDISFTKSGSGTDTEYEIKGLNRRKIAEYTGDLSFEELIV